MDGEYFYITAGYKTTGTGIEIALNILIVDLSEEEL